MVSHPEVNRRLQQFVCLRLDHEQMKRLHESGRLVTPTQGNQILLDPSGNYLPGVDPRGNRYAVDELVELLDDVLHQFPPDSKLGDDLRLAWFLDNPEQHGLPPYFGPESIARLDRKPLLTLAGRLPDWLDAPRFLRAHARQFVWTRGESEGPGRITVEQLEPQAVRLADVDLESADPAIVSRQLDDAWLRYMQQRPMVARGYIDNPHGNWLKAVMERAHAEELRVRAEAEAGTLLPPGR